MKREKKILQVRVIGYLLLGLWGLAGGGLYAEDKVPQVINISTPNEDGLSVNQSPSFAVSKEGLVLNNSGKESQTELVGKIAGNPHIGETGTGARVIINEVTGTGRSRLEGALEVAGQRAEVIIANPNGIDVNGARFINSDHVSLWAGVPIYMPHIGMVRTEATGVQIAGGDIAVGTGGIKTDPGAVLTMMGRTMTIGGPVRAGKIDVNLGKGDLYTEKLKADGITAVSPQQRFLDISSLGGMYANAIYIQTWENGTGIKSQAHWMQKMSLI